MIKQRLTKLARTQCLKYDELMLEKQQCSINNYDGKFSFLFFFFGNYVETLFTIFLFEFRFALQIILRLVF